MEQDKKKPVMGRPKLEKTIDQRLPRIRVTQEQLDAYKKASKREGKTLSEWVRYNLDKVS